MEEKKAIKINLFTCILIIIIIILTIYLFAKNYNSQSLIKSLETKISESQNSIDTLIEENNNLDITSAENTDSEENLETTKTENIIPEKTTSANNKQLNLSSAIYPELINNNTILSISNDRYLKLGNYTVDEITIEDDTGISNEDCGIKFIDDLRFSIYIGWGCNFEGTYIIDQETQNLICFTSMYTTESGGYYYSNLDLIFTFKIIDENTVKLLDIVSENEESKNAIAEDVLIKGMTYSIK